MSRKTFLLDLGRCLGCGACVLACRLENQVPAGVSWRRVLPLNAGRYCGGPSYHFSLACHHCDRPQCFDVCPAGAYVKRPDGVVLVEGKRCVGCRYCEMACPFGAPVYDASAKVMTKCHLCFHRIDAGLAPACVAACPAEALSLQVISETGGTGTGPTAIPGFADPAGCRPNIRFAAPRGRIRSQLLTRLREMLAR